MVIDKIAMIGFLIVGILIALLAVGFGSMMTPGKATADELIIFIGTSVIALTCIGCSKTFADRIDRREKRNGLMEKK